MNSHRFPRLATASLALASIFVLALAFTTSRASARQERKAPVLARVPKVGVREPTSRADVVRAKYPALPLSLDDGERSVLAFPPRDASRALTVVYLHGIHGRPENGCPWLREGASEIGWLVCPAANGVLPNQTFSWAGSVVEQHAVVERAERAAQAAGADAARANVLVGFSQGAFVALDLVRARLGHYRGLVLIGANVAPSRALLDGAGITRIALAAGALDGTFAPLRRAADRLTREGMEVRFVDLGVIGHSYETTEKDALRDAIAWTGGSS